MIKNICCHQTTPYQKNLNPTEHKKILYATATGKMGNRAPRCVAVPTAPHQALYAAAHMVFWKTTQSTSSHAKLSQQPKPLPSSQQVRRERLSLQRTATTSLPSCELLSTNNPSHLQGKALTGPYPLWSGTNSSTSALFTSIVEGSLQRLADAHTTQPPAPSSSASVMSQEQLDVLLATLSSGTGAGRGLEGLPVALV
jgi:hypothetical protein